MGWGNDVLRNLSGKPFYERARRKDPKLDAAIKEAEKSSKLEGGNKFNAKKVYVDGIRFDSIAESERWPILQLNERAGIISDLDRQVVITFESGVTWKIDFVYTEDGATVYEDVKGKITQDYRIKRDTIIFEIQAGIRDGIYREVKKEGRRWSVKEYRKED